MQSWAVLLSMHFYAAVWSAAVPRSAAPEFVNTKLLKEVVGIISGSKTTTLQPPGLADGTGSRCPLKEMTTCFSTALPKFQNSLLQINLKETRQAICSVADEYDTCVAPYKTRCSPREEMTFDLVMTGARYLCTHDGYNSYLALVPCLSNFQVIDKLILCTQRLFNTGSEVNVCTLFDNYTSCAVEATKTTCNADVVGKIRESLTFLLSPMKEAFCSASAQETGDQAGYRLIPEKPTLSRLRRDAFEDFGSFMGPNSWEELGGGQYFTPQELSWGEFPTMSPELTVPEFSWGGIAPQPDFTVPEFSWEFPTVAPYFSGQEISSEEIPTMSWGFPTQEPSSEEVSTTSPDVTTPEPSSEEVSTTLPDITTPEPSSEEVSTAATPDVTTQDASSEEVSTTSPEVSTPEPSSEEVSTTSPDVTTPEPSSEEASTAATQDVTTQDASSEEVSTTSPDVTTPEPSSEEVSTTSQDVTTPEPSSEEASTAATQDVTTQDASSEEVSTTSLDVTTPEPSSEEASTVATQDVTTQDASSEEVSTTSPDVTTQESSSEEVSTTSSDVTTPEPSSEEASTTAPDVTTSEPSSEEASTASPDLTTPEISSEEVSTLAVVPATAGQVTELGPVTVTTLEIPSTSIIITTPDTTAPTTLTASIEATTIIPLYATELENVPPTAQVIPAATDSNASQDVKIPVVTASTTAPDTTAPVLVEASTPETPSTATTLTISEITTASPTTTFGYHVPPFQCYECHSGALGYWQNSFCPSDGNINGWASLPTVCYGPCVSVVTKYPKGEVYRSCSTNYYFTFQPPYDGCIRHNKELFCFCSGDLCNNKNMVTEQQAYIFEGLIVQQ